MTRHNVALGAVLLAATIAGSLGAITTASAAPLTAANGMTLYTYDNDTAGKPTCNALCAIAWPPYVSNGETLGKGWATVQRANGAQQWTFNGKPVYFYSGDRKKGDTAGNGLEGVWHIVNQ